MICFKEIVPSPEEYKLLTSKVDLGSRENSIVKEALSNTLYSLCVYDDNVLIGYGRIVGDKTIFLYTQNIMVLPKYQSKKIGTIIMNMIIDKDNEF